MAKNPETGHVPLLFKYSVSPFNAKEIGGVHVAKAAQLVAKGLAEYADPNDAPAAIAAAKKAEDDEAAKAVAKKKAEEEVDSDESKSIDHPPKHRGILDAIGKRGR